MRTRATTLGLLMLGCFLGCTSDHLAITDGASVDRTTRTSPPEAASQPPAEVRPLPAATKGYELYAWEEQGELRFTLITGTNREKTPAEVTARSSLETEDWIAIGGSGPDELEALLQRVPRGAHVAFRELTGLVPLAPENRAAVEQMVARSAS